MENVLELLRQSDDGLPHAALNVLFACLDCLEEMTGEIESAGTGVDRPRVADRPAARPQGRSGRAGAGPEEGSGPPPHHHEARCGSGRGRGRDARRRAGHAGRRGGAKARHPHRGGRLRHAVGARVPGPAGAERRGRDRVLRSAAGGHRERVEPGRAGRPGRLDRRRRRDAPQAAAHPGGHRRGHRREHRHGRRGRRRPSAAPSRATPPRPSPVRRRALRRPTRPHPWPPRRTRRAARRCASTPSGSTRSCT